MKKFLLFAIIVSLLFASCKQGDAQDSSNPEQEKAKVCSFVRSAELGTVEYEVVKTIKANDVADWYKIGDRKILFECKATLKAGLNMEKFSNEDVTIEPAAKQITINLPKPELLNLDIKPEDIKLLYENVSMFRSGFSASDRGKLLAQGEKNIRNNIEELGILKDAEKNARLYFEAMLLQMGYDYVIVNFKED